ncbi:MAG TPA: ATP-binding cassette domain-containing protein [Clostridia bacterium]|nr:ATP-binding cassette domain-containing protein [Clostridia bacterium]
MAAAGRIDLATVITEINLLANVNYMIRNLGRLIALMQGSLAGGARVLELLEEKPEPESYSVCGENSDQMLELKDVSFAYDDLPVVNGLSISLEKGKRAALVGGSGGGKSTVIKLLLGFYPVNSGVITINGKSLGEYSLGELRSMIAYVPQDAYLFDGTIEENIRLGKADATDEEVKQAAELAFAHEFIEEMPDGYKTVVGERGTRISGGQRQRIAIARALLKDAPILLLDEATSALDSQSEQKVQDAINRLMEGRTVLAIAHRLSTIEYSDVIYVIEDGKVTEQGKHAELLDKGGTYSRLYNLQFSNS